jgi:hypothetical protein
LRQGAVGRAAVAGLPEVAVLGDMLIERHLVGAPAAAPEPLSVARLVDDDAVDPGLERGLPPERVDGAKDAEEDFLGKVEGLVAVAQQVQARV